MQLLKKIFIITGLVMVLYVLIWWTFYAERAVIVLQGEIPDQVTGLPFDPEKCIEGRCEIQVQQGIYNFTMEKKDKYPITERVEIPFFGKVFVDIKFFDKPYLRKIGESRHVDIPLSKIGISLQENQTHIEIANQMNFQKNRIQDITLDNIRQVVYSNTGTGAMIQNDNFVYYYDPLNNTQERTEISKGFQNSVFENNLFWFLKKLENRTYELWNYSLETQALKKEFTLYNAYTPKIFPHHQKVVINDITKSILLDISTGEKKDLNALRIEKLKWSDDSTQFLFEDHLSQIRLFDLQTMEIYDLYLEEPVSFNTLDFYGKNEIVFISTLHQKNDNQIDIMHYDTKTRKKEILLSHTLTNLADDMKLESANNEVYLKIGNTLFYVQKSR